MPGASANGRLAKSAIIKVPTTADTADAVNTAAGSIPAAPRIIGLTARMYAIVIKVVRPAVTSVFTVVPCSDSLNIRSRNPLFTTRSSLRNITAFPHLNAPYSPRTDCRTLSKVLPKMRFCSLTTAKPTMGSRSARTPCTKTYESARKEPSLSQSVSHLVSQRVSQETRRNDLHHSSDVINAYAKAYASHNRSITPILIHVSVRISLRKFLLLMCPLLT